MPDPGRLMYVRRARCIDCGEEMARYRDPETQAVLPLPGLVRASAIRDDGTHGRAGPLGLRTCGGQVQFEIEEMPDA